MKYNLYCNERYFGKNKLNPPSANLDSFKKMFLSEFRNPNKKSNYKQDEFEVDMIPEHEIVLRDLEKVIFGFEMISAEKDTFDDNGGVLLGFQSIRGFPFVGFLAGNSCEEPVYFIVYHDGCSFRAYIPTTGNLYNKSAMTAFGSEQDSKSFIKLFMGFNTFDNQSDIIGSENKKLIRQFSDVPLKQIDELIHTTSGNIYTCRFAYNWSWLLRDIKSAMKLDMDDAI